MRIFLKTVEVSENFIVDRNNSPVVLGFAITIDWKKVFKVFKMVLKETFSIRINLVI